MIRVSVEIGFSFKRELAANYRLLVIEDGTDVRGALEALVRKHQMLRERLFDANGSIRRNIAVLANGENVVLRRGLDTPLSHGDRLTLLPPVGGG